MPIRQTQAKLWFHTKEELDEYDDKMITSIQLKSDDQNDDNYSPIFKRPKKEFVLALSDKVAQQIYSVKVTQNISKSRFRTLNNIEKNDNTAYREWTFQKIPLMFFGSYLILREIPIRNFYARSLIMIVFFCKMSGTFTLLPSLNGIFPAIWDPWTAKDIRNYEAFNDSRIRVIPNSDNKLNQARIWKLAQPGFMRWTPEKSQLTSYQLLFSPEQRNVAWDGTWNMPLHGLANPLHKDAKYYDFITV